MAGAPGISWTVLASGAGLAFVVAGAGWTLFQDKFMRQDIEITRLRDEQTKYVTIREHEEFKSRLNDRFGADEKRLDVLEQTRPTTGELSAISKNAETAMQRFEDRIRLLENRRLEPSSQPAR